MSDRTALNCRRLRQYNSTVLQVFCISLALSIPAFAGVAASPPIETSVTSLSLHPDEFNGRLVRVHAVLSVGFEGDDFLLDPSNPSPLYMPSRDPASVWFYSRPMHEQQVYGAIGSNRIIYGVFLGYFHVLDKPQLAKGLFNPGPLQFEAVESSVPNQQPHSLAAASLERDVDETRRFLRSDVDIANKYRDILLFLAAETGRDDFAQELLMSGADAKFAGAGGETSLIRAAWNCKLEVAKTLLSHGAPVNAANAHGETALIMAAQTCKDGRVVQLLLAAGANLNTRTINGVTPLIAAAGNPNNVGELLKAGADPLMKTDSGETVESESCGRGKEEYFQVCQLIRQALRNRETRSPK